MATYKLKTHYRQYLADTLTPVSIYLKLRDRFANAILLESSDYHGTENSFSYICFQPIARFEMSKGKVSMEFPDKKKQEVSVTKESNAMKIFQSFLKSFDVEKPKFDFIQNGLFGYTTYDSVRYFEDIEVQDFKEEKVAIPEMLYQVYQYVIAINHFKNELYIFEHLYKETASHLTEIESLLNNKNFPAYHFTPLSPEKSNLSDEEYIDIVKKGIQHCKRGDVFQIVLSRQFSRPFRGDEFNVYRALRSINPSPYLFYFDYGNFKIFGSSPEAQLVIKDDKAEIHPIAGTFKRTGNDKADAELAKELFEDEKETSEHVMLVDLARNDLSRNGSEVRVENLKEIQYYSHLIHLVSKVTAQLPKNTSHTQLFADTFPAGTLSGAPKYKAMELINLYENQNRGYYGGAIGYLNFQGDLNHAIMIRSFLSKGNHLYFQAGAGIVAKSQPRKELEEVNNKLRALRTALEAAEKI